MSLLLKYNIYVTKHLFWELDLIVKICSSFCKILHFCDRLWTEYRSCFFGETQPGNTHYYTPLSVYNLGAVNSAYVHIGEDEQNNHMHCHVYDEGIAGKVSNNVSSVIMKVLDGLDLLKNDDSGGELNIIFDNFSGWKKNNTVLKLVPFFCQDGIL